MPTRFGEYSTHRVGLPTGYLYEMNSIEEVFEAYKKQMDFFVKWHAGCINSFEYIARQNMPLPVVSSTMEGCMEKGRDVMFGGAKYNTTGIAGVGIGNVADCLNIVDHLCFKTKNCTTRVLYDAIMSNWQGYDKLNWYIKNSAPHYGNADSDIDKWGQPRFGSLCKRRQQVHRFARQVFRRIIPRDDKCNFRRNERRFSRRTFSW